MVVGSHQLAKAFVRQKHEVLHVSAPLTVAHLALAVRDSETRRRFKTWWAGGRLVEGVQNVVPFGWLPWDVARLSGKLRNFYPSHMLSGPLRSVSSLQLEAAECLIVDEPRMVGMATRVRGRTLMYRATDLYAQMRRDATITDAERLICGRADILVATSHPVAAHLRQISGRPVHIISNGVEFDHFASAASTAEQSAISLPGSYEERAVYAGAFDRRFGIGALSAAARAHKQKQFILIGPGSLNVASRIKLANVFALGAVSYARLPQILRQCKVGLLPMSPEASNAGRSPMKFFEYAAVGLAVAATSTAELRGRSLATLCLADGDANYAAAVADAFDRSWNKPLIAEAREVARKQDWAVKANDLLALVEGQGKK